ncbi:MAG: hypothetical protein JXR52_06340 [Bacteroidales bacterium]|nr:hypothetical protein [Bacteroidales bacterium]
MKMNRHRHCALSMTVITLLILIFSCKGYRESQPSMMPEWGIIPNGSAEKVVSSTVENWTPAEGRNTALHFYSSEAHDGNKSLHIYSSQPAYGVWRTRVAVKPWSVYKFTGWMKTEGLVNQEGEGAGFYLVNLSESFNGMSGTNDWTEVTMEFETGCNDSFVLECLFNRGGRSSGRVWFDNMKLEPVSSEKINTAFTIDASGEKEPMPLYIYGQFIEHLGRCIYGGIWAEMIDDRKFWYEPGDRMSPWTISGNRILLKMDRSNSFVGDQTPVMACRGEEKAILRQDGLGLRPEMDYNGRIILKSSGSVNSVTIRLINNSNGQTVGENVISGLNGTYETYPLSFRSGIFTHNASIEVIPEGNGKVWLGTLSLMPADNIEGFRADVMELLKGLKSPVYRWPGGNFVSGYDWKDGIGDRDKRPPRKNPAWRGVEHNDVGIHEFMKFCELLETEPYIAVNAGLGGAEEARKQVEYCNGTGNTPMGRWRGANGHPEPWKVKWWSVGNEMYGSWQIGHMPTEEFVEKHNQFASAMRSVDPDILLVAVGDPGPWDEMILSNCADNMDYISEHFYRQDWHGGGLMTHIRQIPDVISERAEIHRKYRKEIPSLEGKDIRICMDEWNYWYGPHIYGELGTRYFLRDALGIAAGINAFSRNSDIIYMANYAQTVNVIGCIKTNTTHSVYASTGQALKMYREYFGTIPVEISGETRPFDVAAAFTEDHSVLVLSVVNPTWEQQEFDMKIKGIETGSHVEIVALTGPDDMAYNEPGREESVIIEEPVYSIATGRYIVKPFSATLFRFYRKPRASL